MFRRVFLRGDLLPFAWLVIGKEYGEAGLMSGIFYVGYNNDMNLLSFALCEFLVPAGRQSVLVLLMIGG